MERSRLDHVGADCSSFDHDQASEDNFIRELRKIQVLADAGLYTNPRQPCQIIPSDWMVVYVTAFPLDEEDAADALVTKVLAVRQDQRRAQVNNKQYEGMTKLVSKVHTLLHQHPSRQHKWLKLDVDTKDPRHLVELYKALQGATIVQAVETRGGYHVILERGSWCRDLYAMASRVNKGVALQDQWITIENNPGPMVAVPGTSQGGFTVLDVTEDWRQAVASASVPPPPRG